MLLIRILQGEEQLGNAFWVTLAILLVFIAYDTYMPSFSSFYQEHFKMLRIFFVAGTAVCIHNCSGNARRFPRLCARFYVVMLVIWAMLKTREYYGDNWALAVPFLVALAVFIVRADKSTI